MREWADILSTDISGVSRVKDVEVTRFSGYDTEIWIETADGVMYPKHRVHALGPLKEGTHDNP